MGNAEFIVDIVCQRGDKGKLLAGDIGFELPCEKGEGEICQEGYGRDEEKGDGQGHFGFQAQVPDGAPLCRREMTEIY